MKKTLLKNEIVAVSGGIFGGNVVAGTALGIGLGFLTIKILQKLDLVDKNETSTTLIFTTALAIAGGGLGSTIDEYFVNKAKLANSIATLTNMARSVFDLVFTLPNIPQGAPQ